MGYSKQIGPLSISEDAGEVKLAISMEESLGGGSVAGKVKGKVSAEVDVEAKDLIDVGFALAESQYPSVAAYLKMAQAAIDAELAKV